MSNLNKKIFVFDDDKAILDIFTLVLEFEGYIVYTSETSNDIIEKVNHIQPDLIIMDNWIPNIGGIEATKRIKKHKYFRHIPVIFCSANSEIISLAAEAGADTYLSKPFDLSELENLVADMLQHIELK